MDRNQISCRPPVYDRLPPLSAKYPWLVAQKLEEAEDDIGDQVFYTIRNTLSHYQYCRIPELSGRRIRGCFHGWVILPNNIMWSLWNPMTSRFIHLPPLIGKKRYYECCLSSSPDDPCSVLMLNKTAKSRFLIRKSRFVPDSKIVFCRLNRKRLKWMEMSYSKQLRRITGEESVLHSLTSCNGKMYALNTGYDCDYFVIHIDIVVEYKKVSINLLPIVKLPSGPGYCFTSRFLKGSCSELFVIYLCFKRKLPCYVHLFKLDMDSNVWEEMEDLKDAIFFINLATDYSICYIPASELGGYIHIIGQTGEVLYSVNVKDKTIALFSMPDLALPPKSGNSRTRYVSVWAIPECRLQAEYGELMCNLVSKQEADKEDELVVNGEVEIFKSTKNQHQEQKTELHLLDLPLHVLEMIMEFCVDVSYVNFRATCKQLTAPVIKWINGTVIKRLQTYPLVSPWLVVLDTDRGIITFTDPMFGDKYFTRTPRDMIGDFRIYNSMYGWLLMCKDSGDMMFFNPFTSNIHKLPCPYVSHFESCCFSAPPTFPNCMVVGFTTLGKWHVYIHFVAEEQTWLKRTLDLVEVDRYSFHFPTFFGENIYYLNNGGLDVIEEEGQGYYFHEVVVIKSPGSCSRYSTQHFLVKRKQKCVLVIVDEFGECVEVFKLNHRNEEWKKIDDLGKYMIYICGTSCLCIKAKTKEMENKIFFPLLHSQSGKMVFYSLETRRYHTFIGKTIEDSLCDLVGTKQLFYPHAWIVPSFT